jgi:hypothetical protein
MHKSGNGLLTATASLSTEDERTPMSTEDRTDYITSSVRSEQSQTPPTPVNDDSSSSRYSASVSSPSSEAAMLQPGMLTQPDGLRRAALVSTSARSNKVHSIIIYGPPGYAISYEGTLLALTLL